MDGFVQVKELCDVRTKYGLSCRDCIYYNKECKRIMENNEGAAPCDLPYPLYIRKKKK